MKKNWSSKLYIQCDAWTFIRKPQAFVWTTHKTIARKIMGNISEEKVCINLFNKVSMIQNLTIITSVYKYLNLLRIYFWKFQEFFLITTCTREHYYRYPESMYSNITVKKLRVNDKTLTIHQSESITAAWARSLWTPTFWNFLDPRFWHGGLRHTLMLCGGSVICLCR